MQNNTYIAILTDSNRSTFRIEVTDQPFNFNQHKSLTDLVKKAYTRADSSELFDQKDQNTRWRLVYSENHTHIEEAQNRVSEIYTYTRMQIERLIRKTNPNWKNLCYMDTCDSNRHKSHMNIFTTNPEKSLIQTHQNAHPYVEKG